MASQAYTITPKVRFINTKGTLALDTIELDGLDSDAVDALNAFFTASGALTTVAITQVAANRGGYGEDGPYSNVKMVFSA